MGWPSRPPIVVTIIRPVSVPFPSTIAVSISYQKHRIWGQGRKHRWGSKPDAYKATAYRKDKIQYLFILDLHFIDLLWELFNNHGIITRFSNSRGHISWTKIESDLFSLVKYSNQHCRSAQHNLKYLRTKMWNIICKTVNNNLI